MTIPKFIIAVLIVSYLTSCSRTFRLLEQEHSWIPYKGNEILVFSSNKGDTDTIFFIKKDTVIAYPEAQAINGVTYEVVSIFGRHSDPSSPDGNHRYLENNFIELKKSKDKNARLHINLSAKDAAFYRLTAIKVESLAQQPPISMATKTKTYSDVYVIYDQDGRNFKQRSNYVTKLYWSKAEGLIRYDKHDGIFWELTTKYSP